MSSSLNFIYGFVKCTTKINMFWYAVRLAILLHTATIGFDVSSFIHKECVLMFPWVVKRKKRGVWNSQHVLVFLQNQGNNRSVVSKRLFGSYDIYVYVCMIKMNKLLRRNIKRDNFKRLEFHKLALLLLPYESFYDISCNDVYTIRQIYITRCM